LFLGAGTGAAYALCNVPGIFAGAPEFQTSVAIAACLLGALAVFGPRPPVGLEQEPRTRSTGSYEFVPLIVLFLAMVWLDSAAFSILQATPEVNQYGWGSTSLQWSNAGIHFAAAILAGAWLDRRGLMQVLLIGFGCLAVAAVCVSSHPVFASSAHWFYATGVSFYSTALVFTPGLVANGDRIRGAARRAGSLYSIAGWIGSALGVGMAQDLHSIPMWFVTLAGIAVAIHAAWILLAQRRVPVPITALVAAGGALIFAVSRTSGGLATTDAGAPAPAPNPALGREVYISEGCIHCHSQYVRPNSLDVEWWGPAADIQQVLREEPPLIGNRRQGPDLLNIGNRRSSDWIRLHLLDPQSLIPTSRMPSYARLFRPGDPRGEALVDYLAQRGADTIPERFRIRAQWVPKSKSQAVSEAQAARIFQRNCQICHGSEGAGNGPLADRLGTRRPRDLIVAQWQFIPPRTEDEDRLVELARVIKFGIPGTSMPGHETMAEGEVLGLARHVTALHTTSRIPRGSSPLE
jgi:cbb3-type cytochrome oxidase cytochrome c subunit